MSRCFNFSAGPAMLPTEVLQKAQSEMSDFNDSGMSIMEMSHRGKVFMDVASKAEADLRELLNISEDYSVLFMQGGASAQFAMIPMNLLGDKTQVDYINTGAWSKKAIAEAKRFADVNVAANSEDTKFSNIPEFSNWKLNKDAAYLHYTPNETIGGVEFHWVPETNGVPLVADLSSTILSRPIDVSKFGIIYAGAQKNIGPAGLTIAIVRKDLMGKTIKNTPAVFDYKNVADNDSMANTPPTYSWYLAGLVFDWIKKRGGLEAMATVNKRKADKLYAAIDQSDFYQNPVQVDCRSWMNIPFTLADADLDKLFLQLAEERGLKTLKGHRSVGGMRASIYNAMPEEGVDELINFMQVFEKENA
ncbi:Phosphoserine aminotransferase [hydrothermal vent metagenome]|uniref:phosphoserine transaminase n=1 Tax=hydrothermal vent metagenome TaxID=652676 RepID=A0A3B0ZGV6_9ZZZZ